MSVGHLSVISQLLLVYLLYLSLSLLIRYILEYSYSKHLIA